MNDFLKGSLSPVNIFRWIKYKSSYKKKHPDELGVSGLLVFCGHQGSGKTLSAVQYLTKLSYAYPKAIICTNTDISSLNPASQVVEYDGLDSLKNISNGELGVIYFIDEFHLELNSLESKNIDIDVMIELSQQRKQRKHIVGTSQVYMRLAKPVREQMQNVVNCKNFFGFIQWNRLFDATIAYEEDGKLVCPRSRLIVWLHDPRMYDAYDTFAKMRRYNKEWKGRRRSEEYARIS